MLRARRSSIALRRRSARCRQASALEPVLEDHRRVLRLDEPIESPSFASDRCGARRARPTRATVGRLRRPPPRAARRGAGFARGAARRQFHPWIHSVTPLIAPETSANRSLVSNPRFLLR
jgi:hypothetical protein